MSWHMQLFGRNEELCLAVNLSLLLVSLLRECHAPHLQGLNCTATVGCNEASGHPYKHSHFNWSRTLIKLPLGLLTLELLRGVEIYGL